MIKVTIIATVGANNAPYFSVVTDEGFVIGGSSDKYEALEIVALLFDEIPWYNKPMNSIFLIALELIAIILVLVLSWNSTELWYNKPLTTKGI